VDGHPDAVDILVSVDMRMRSLAFEDRRPVDGNGKFETDPLSRDLRRWVHQRCEQLGFESRTKGRNRAADTGVVLVIRRTFWELPTRPLGPRAHRRRKRPLRDVGHGDVSDATSLTSPPVIPRHLECPPCHRCGAAISSDGFYCDVGTGSVCQSCILSENLIPKWLPVPDADPADADTCIAHGC
jgi:hypothetical protein